MRDEPKRPGAALELIRCRRCNAHLKRVDTSPRGCVFCGTATDGGGLRGFLYKSRSSVLAASLFGVTSLQACEGSSPQVMRDAASIDVVTTGDAHAEISDDATGSTDVPPTDSGQPPETSGSDAAADDGAAEPDVLPIPPYGIPPDEPDAEAVHDVTEDADTGEGTEELPLPMPVYGLPPSEESDAFTEDGTSDASTKDADAADSEASDSAPLPMPVYGLPP